MSELRFADSHTGSIALREFQLEDSEFIIQLLNDPDWKRFIGDFEVTTKDAAVDYLNSRIIPSYRNYGYGLFALVEREQNRLVGMCGLVNRPQLTHPDLGFAVLPEFRNKGLVSSASRLVMQLAASRWAINTLDAITNPANTASIRLLTSLGFREQEKMTLQPDSPPVVLFRAELT